jgi:hypothetical protein
MKLMLLIVLSSMALLCQASPEKSLTSQDRDLLGLSGILSGGKYFKLFIHMCKQGGEEKGVYDIGPPLSKYLKQIANKNVK